MEYTIRRYEAIQRLLWFVFFLICLGAAYPAMVVHQDSFGGTAVIASVQPEVLKTPEFWVQTYWLGVGPFGKAILYLYWVALLFLAGKFVWLLTQYVGRSLVKAMLLQAIRSPSGGPKPAAGNLSADAQRLFPAGALLKRASSIPLRFLFHPFQRLRLMLINPHEVLSSDELTEKERRVVEIDWQVFWSSWAPFRWLLWLLPLLALIQTCWLFYLQLAPAITAQKAFDDLFGPLLASLLPVVQVIVAAIAFNLASGLLKRLENLYLSSVDALFYDQLVSRVPFQSSDTVVILEALQKHFKELQAILQRIELNTGGGTDTTGSKP